MTTAQRSSHPVDRLIQAVVARPRVLTDQELEKVRRHVVTRSLDPRPARVTADIRKLPGSWGDRPFATLWQLPLGEIHLIQRTLIDQQWPPGTTLPQYLSGLYNAVRAAAGVFTYTHELQAYIGFLAPTSVAGPRSEPLTWVAYSGSYGWIRTGYQTRTVATIFRRGFPWDWFRQR